MKNILGAMMVLVVVAVVTMPVSGHSDTRFDKNLRFAEQGEAWAQTLVGVSFYTGTGTTRDYQQAVHWFQQAANQGFAEAQYNLAFMYRTGKGVNPNVERSVYWYKQAASGGYVTAQFHLGNMYYKGLGVTRDYTEAAAWWYKAAQLGAINAQGNLGAIYIDGEGVPQDYLECYAWSSLAATGGHKPSVQNREFCAQQLDPDSLALAKEKVAEYAMWYSAE